MSEGRIASGGVTADPPVGVVLAGGLATRYGGNRKGLERASCPCYLSDIATYDRFIG